MTDTESAGPEALFNRQAERNDWPTRADSTLSFQNENFAQLVRLWQGKMRGAELPRRSDFTARELKRVLRNLIFFERVGESEQARWRVRFIGSGVAAVTGDMTGHFLDEFIPAELYPRWHAALGAIFAARRPIRFLGRIDIWDQQHIAAEIFAAPLAGAGATPAMAMATFRFHAAVPPREDAVDMRALALVNAR